MGYVDEIFKRTDLQQIREFLLHESRSKPDARSYQERLEAAHRQMLACLKNLEDEQYERLLEAIYIYAGTVEAVYMEIGLQAGAMLGAQLLSAEPYCPKSGEFSTYFMRGKRKNKK